MGIRYRRGISCQVQAWVGLTGTLYHEGEMREVLEGGTQRSGYIFGNFCTGRGPYPPYQMMWCGGCYADESDKFPPKWERQVEVYWES